MNDDSQGCCGPWMRRCVGGVLLVAAGAVGVVACLKGGLLGPPSIEGVEAYSAGTGEATFDHSRFDALLKRHVDEDGWVDYAALHKDPSELDAYIAALAGAAFDELGRDEKLALLINAYNAFTLRLIIDHYPLKSIRDIPKAQRWAARRWRVAGNTWSLNDIEHEQVRAKFAEPRVHFALVCASVGCPPLRNEAFTADRLEAQLQDQTRYVHTHDRWFRFDAARNTVHLTRLFDWYGGDFEQAAGSVTAFVSRYVPAVKSAVDGGKKIRIKWLKYDWSINDASKAP